MGRTRAGRVEGARRGAALDAVIALLCMVGLTYGQPIVFRVDCGRPADGQTYTDFLGRHWAADQAYESSVAPKFGYIGGEPGACIVPGIVGGSVHVPLYLTNRIGFSEYRFDVPEGFYAVGLHFAETCVHGRGLRVFDIFVEGAPARLGFDIAAEVGKDYALEYTFPAIVTDGVLNVSVQPFVGQPLLSAISVVQVWPDTDGPLPPAGFEAMGGFGANILKWNAHYENDWTGCHVYRSTSPTGPFVRVNPELVVTRRYVDRDVLVGTPYYYQVRAVDLWGNEGPMAETLSATPVDDSATALPVYNLYADAGNLDALNIDPTADFLVPGAVLHANEFFPSIETGYSGRADRLLTKKNWQLRFTQEQLFDHRAVVTLQSGFSDPSMLREYLSYGIMLGVGLPIPDVHFVHFNINNVFRGVYLDVETVDSLFLSRHGFDPSGNLYEALNGTMETAAIPEDYLNTYAKLNNDTTDYSDLIYFIEKVNFTHDDAFPAVIHQLIDVPEFLDYYAAMILTSNYNFTASNYFWYHDPARDKWVIIPWNPSASLGAAPWLGQGIPWATPLTLGVENEAGPYSALFANRLITRMMHVEAFRDYVADRLSGWIGVLFNPAALDPVIDSTFDLVQFDARRDLGKFGWERNEPFNAGPSELKDFIAHRGPFLLEYIPYFAPQAGPYLYVNEVMSLNASTVLDDHGELAPWIELYNAGPAPLDLSGLYLTTDLNDPTRWRIPPGVAIAGGGHLLFWADGTPDQGPTHATLDLNPYGGVVAIFASDGQSPLNVFFYGPQFLDHSNGLMPDGSNNQVFLPVPTPWTFNRPVNSPPTISQVRREPSFPTATDPVFVTCVVEDDRRVDSVALLVDIGLGPISFGMSDDGLHGDGAADDHIYGGVIPPLPDGVTVYYHVLASDDQSALSVDPPNAPQARYSYRVGFSPQGNFTPAEGATLQAVEVLFSFDAIAAADGYELDVAIDDGSADPFATGTPVVNIEINRPRCIVTEGLQFGTNYVWRVRPLDKDGLHGPWYPVHRFSIAPLDPNLQSAVHVTHSLPGYEQPGLTMFLTWAIPGATTANHEYMLAVDATGKIVWFLRTDLIMEEVGADMRLLRNGNILFGKPPHAYELALDGTIVWSTEPFGLDIDNHEVFDMPNGNVMTMINEFQTVIRNSQPQTWRGHVLTEITREGDVVWTWNTFDHLSTLDFDECVMEFPDPLGTYDWIHGNAVVYDAVEKAVYYSSRHLSRIVKIDYATGDVVYNMGFDMPSGEVNFGDDLFSFQHSPHILRNGHMMLYDNGNRRGHSQCASPNPHSAALELAIDPDAPQPVTVVWRYDQNVYSATKGDADRLANGNTLITTDSADIEEVNLQGESVWKLELPFPAATYRADRIPSLYPLRGDSDGDDDLDLRDFGGMQGCFRGHDGTAIHRDCLVFDYDEDGDVDAEDFIRFTQSVQTDGRPQ